MTSLDRDRRGKGRIDEMGGLNSIVSYLVVILETIAPSSREESLEKCPNLTFSCSERTRIVALIGVEMDFMVL